MYPETLETENLMNLIPIKGINRSIYKKLKLCNIYDTYSLLTKCKTKEQRDEISKKIGIEEENIIVWVKQADLWRVSGMTTDTAYLLVQAGVRNVEDVSKLDIEKIYPVLQRLSINQPGFELVNEDIFKIILKNAEELFTCNINLLDYHTALGDEIEDKLSDIVNKYVVSLYERRENHIIINPEDKLKIKEGKFSQRIISEKIREGLKKPDRFLREIIDESFNVKELMNDFNYGDHVNTFEIQEPPPYFYFKEIYIPKGANGNSLKDGMTNFEQLGITLPLPRVLKGRVVNTLEGNYSNFIVTLTGVSKPISDCKKVNEDISTISDSQGNFELTMPEKYNFQEEIVVTISRNNRKQSFKRNPTDIIRSVHEQEYLNEIVEYDKMQLLLKKGKLHNYLNNNSKKLTFEKFYENDSLYASQEDSLYYYRKKLIDRESPNITFDSQNKIMIKNKLEAFLGEFIILDELFINKEESQGKTLPSVKLMGEDEKSVHLSTNTSPTRIFRYNMLQRLVDPDITSGEREIDRKMLSSPINVDAFKTNIYRNPNSIAKMSSLGMGYVLNMHQAWVPDGFSLGNLLYSLILAPGEEQKLVVREKSQSYSIIDSAQGIDSVMEDYKSQQADDTGAVFSYAMDQASNGSSSYKYNSESASVGLALGLTFGYSESSGSSSSNVSQQNSHNEASSAAQYFHSLLQSGSEKISQSKRVSMSSATGQVSDSIATKIIANHNHSHTLTVQYWEVMRRYKLETCIDAVELVLFVPLDPIKFLPSLESEKLNISSFNSYKLPLRYNAILKYYDTLYYRVPYNYRNGLELIKNYASYPNWTVENLDGDSKIFTIKFDSSLFKFDKIEATLYMKNNRAKVEGQVKIEKFKEIELCTSKKDILCDLVTKRKEEATTKVKITFDIPPTFEESDLSYIKLEHNYVPISYALDQSEESKDNSKFLQHAQNRYIELIDDVNKMRNVLEEFSYNPNLSYSMNELNTVGSPKIKNLVIVNKNENRKDEDIKGKNNIHGNLSDYDLSSTVYINLTSTSKILRYSDIKKMEETFRHIYTNTLHYSQVIWSSLTTDERVMLLEKYTIDMDFSELKNKDLDYFQENKVDMSLLSCVNIHKPLGYYGNCLVLPFTYPESLAEKLGKTAKEIQDSLYQYHSSSFRAPTSVITLPTQGMIGEAVLGETNVSEKIDLTRFWNWQDSPITRMDLDSSYLSNEDYLAGKSTKDINPLGLTGASSPELRKVNDVLSSLIKKVSPEFRDYTGQDQASSILDKSIETNAAGRDQVIKTSGEVVQKALDVVSEFVGAKKGSSSTPTPTGTGGANETPQPSPSEPSPTSPPSSGNVGQEGKTESKTGPIAANPQYYVPTQVVIPLSDLQGAKKEEKPKN